MSNSNNKHDWDSFFINPNAYNLLSTSVENFNIKKCKFILFSSEEGMGKRFYIRKLSDNDCLNFKKFYFCYSSERNHEPLYPFISIIKYFYPRKEDFLLMIKKTQF